MCFAPQRHALFGHVNFKKCSEPGVLCAFWLGNMLCAITAHAFSTSQLRKVLRTWCVLYILTWKCASRHSGVHFSTSQLLKAIRSFDLEMCFAPQQRAIFHLSSGTRRFSEPAFRPSGATNHWKNASSFFSLFLFSDLLLFSSLTLPTSAFPSVYIVGSLTSKLPSTSILLISMIGIIIVLTNY